MKKHSLILPKCDNEGKRTDVALNLLKRIVGDASKEFGGCSVLEGSGYWIMDTGELRRDDWFRIEILSDNAESFVVEASTAIKIDLGQEAVLVSIENCEVNFV